MDFKKTAAITATNFIQDKSSIGLGAGSTISHIVELLAEKRKDGLDVQIFTSSFSTHQLLLERGFNVPRISDIAKLDIYLDGCDQFDRDLNALKSGGGIHTREKLLASMADLFLLVGDDSKYVERFDLRFPLVIEILPAAIRYVPRRIQELFPEVKIALRINNKTDGAAITENGNYLLDTWFQQWPDLAQLNPIMKSVTGVVETSLFFGLAHKAIIAGAGGIKVLERHP